METKKVLLKHQFVGSTRDLPIEYSVDSERKIITVVTHHFDSLLMTFFLTSHLVDLDVLYKNEGWVSAKPEYNIVLLLNKVKYMLTAHLGVTMPTIFKKRNFHCAGE